MTIRDSYTIGAVLSAHTRNNTGLQVSRYGFCFDLTGPKLAKRTHYEMSEPPHSIEDLLENNNFDLILQRMRSPFKPEEVFALQFFETAAHRHYPQAGFAKKALTPVLFLNGTIVTHDELVSDPPAEPLLQKDAVARALWAGTQDKAVRTKAGRFKLFDETRDHLFVKQHNQWKNTYTPLEAPPLILYSSQPV